jgi:4a-hydroxytetrahydrobiopterin dehydratase
MASDWNEVEYSDGKTGQKALRKEFIFSDFSSALDFVNKVGELAEEADHHPDINFGWGYVEITLFTHSEKKITKKDYELAKAIDQL